MGAGAVAVLSRGEKGRAMTPEAAKALFATELAAFAAKYPRAKGCQFAIRAKHFLPNPDPRDLAWYDPDAHTVTLTRAALDRSNGCILGIIRHELGHASDPKVEVDRGCERRADHIAEDVTGKPMRYTADGVQHATHGTVGRPEWLPQ